MEYSNLISVTGMSGLFELLTSKSDGAIAKSLDNGTTQFLSTRAHQFSHLESIEVFTTHDNVFLAEVFMLQVVALSWGVVYKHLSMKHLPYKLKSFFRIQYKIGYQ